VVPWGDQSFDEMFFTALRYRWVDETSDHRVAWDDDLKATQLFGMLDDNVDGKLQAAELKGGMSAPLKLAFKQIDSNGDGAIDEKEFAVAQAMVNRGQGRRAEVAEPARN
jgi:Ca2+-binding EF-hand superfamily protein